MLSISIIWETNTVKAYVTWAPRVPLFTSVEAVYGLTVESWSPSLASEQHKDKGWILFIWHHNGLFSFPGLVTSNI